ncbi:Protein phosphatase 1H [Liparis tanakae]|uniref:Protein phosphatase 1H n=1 Tax=Liparis tanakae TaxID=230148 RepID=A0A4Z2HP76_9TELE|nr:Protein phosphatase 1H [Liparis tanakae]
MLTRVKSAVSNFMGGVMAGGSNGDHPGGSELPLKYPYGRPEFLGLSADEIECSADHIARPILILKESKRLPWSTGYADCGGVMGEEQWHRELGQSCSHDLSPTRAPPPPPPPLHN